MAGESAGHPLQPTELVHEVRLRLSGSDGPSFQNRAHYFGAAAVTRSNTFASGRRHGAASKVRDSLQFGSFSIALPQ
jgi:hypothetical protein